MIAIYNDSSKLQDSSTPILPIDIPLIDADNLPKG